MPHTFAITLRKKLKSLKEIIIFIKSNIKNININFAFNKIYKKSHSILQTTVLLIFLAQLDMLVFINTYQYILHKHIEDIMFNLIFNGSHMQT